MSAIARPIKIGFHSVFAAFVFPLLLGAIIAGQYACGAQSPGDDKKAPSPRSALALEKIPFKIVHETYRRTDGKENWELCLVNADGSNSVNLTATPDVDEMYPHASPDGTKICFVTDVGTGKDRLRSVWYMNIDGSGRVKVADNAREPCWSSDGKTIAYVKGEYERYTITDYATKGLVFYNIETGQHKAHPDVSLHHLYNVCWSPDGDWFVSTVHGGMGFKHAILAFPAGRAEVFDLTKYGVTGCRPDFSADGKMITWGLSDCDLCVANIELGKVPAVSGVHKILTCDEEHEVYHTDFSPDGKYIAFSYGPKADEMVGGKAPGWNICVVDMSGVWVQVTTDGNHNKEPDWVPIPTLSR
jgi:Tol biopolymer transport system component